MISSGTCVPSPGLHKATGVYALARGLLSPCVLVDPMVRTMPGEQALVAHEFFHVQDRHGIKYLVSCIVLFVAVNASTTMFVAGAPLIGWLGYCVTIAWLALHLLWLRWCEVESDRWALESTDPLTFVQFIHLHPHPKGKWARWLYGASWEARIRRVLPAETN